MDALLKGLHGCESLKRCAEQDYRRMASLCHGHRLQCLQSEVFPDVICGEHFFNNYDLVVDLAESNEKVAVGCGGVDFKAEFIERCHGGFKPLRSGKRQEGRLVRRADKIEFRGHGYFSLRVAGMGG